MLLPRSVMLRVRYALSHVSELRSGSLQVDPRWLNCIEETLSALSREKRIFFEDYFIRNLTNDEVLFNQFIERTTMYNWHEEIMTGVALRAAAAGLIKVSE